MKHKSLLLNQLIGIFVATGLATLAHDLYLIIPNPITAIIFPANECVWEHAKLYFVPLIIYYIIGYFIVGKKYSNYVFSHALSLILMPVLMILGFYFYTIVLSIPSSLIPNIILTILIIVFGFVFSYVLTISKKDLGKYKKLAILIVCLMIVMYGVFTFFQPKVGLFYDTYNSCYGIVKNHHN